MTASAYSPDTGGLNWTDCDRTKGREQAGPCGFSGRAHREHRPRDRLSGHVARAAVPPSVVPAWSLPIAGEILTSHIRSIDTQARPIRYAGVAVSDEIARLVRAKLNTFITI